MISPTLHLPSVLLQYVPFPFLHDTQYIHDIQVERALRLWSKGRITKESHDNAKQTKSSSILKVRGKDGRQRKQISVKTSAV
jgi:hypothetical protein